MVTSELKTNDVDTSESQCRDFKSYLSDRLMGTKSSVPQQSLPMYWYILNILTDVDEEFQRTYKASDDGKYRVASSDFEKYCTTSRLEGSNFTGRNGNKNSYRVQCCIRGIMNCGR